MSQKPKNPVEAWKEANNEARIAENALARAWDEYEAGKTGPIHPGLIKDVSELRSRANDLLTVALHSLSKR